MTFGGINENIHIREQKLECAIENIPNEPRIFSKCETSTCGRFVSDQILTESEANNLKYEIINLFDKSSKNEKIESMTEKITNDNGELRDTIKVSHIFYIYAFSRFDRIETTVLNIVTNISDFLGSTPKSFADYIRKVQCSS